MKILGWAAVVVAIGIGMFVISQLTGKAATEECARKCPGAAGALKPVFELGPISFIKCECPSGVNNQDAAPGTDSTTGTGGGN